MIFHAHLLRSPSKSNFIHKQTVLTFSTQTQTQIQTHQLTQSSLPHTKQSHANFLTTGFLPRSITAAASLILSYATFGDSKTSRILFHSSIQYCRTAFLWNTFVRACTISGSSDGFEVYNVMIRSGIKPDDHTFPFVLKSCFDHFEVLKGREVHGLVFKCGFDKDVFVGNTIMLFYGRCGDLSDAQKVFEEMSEKDVVSWNTLIGIFSAKCCSFEALGLFRKMVMSSTVEPNLVSVVSVLPVCAGLEDEVTTSMVHCYVMKIGFDSQVTTRNALVDAYGKCGSFKAAKKVFSEMSDRNEVSWNAIITACSCTGHKRDGLDLFRLMIDSGLKPDPVTVSSVLPMLVELECFDIAKELHGFSIRANVESDIFIANSLIYMYAKAEHSLEAFRVFNNIETKNVVSWNAMVANYAQNGFEFEAIELVREMQKDNEIPNEVTFTNILPACARTSSIRPGKEIHGRSIRTGSAFELFVSNALIDMYAKCGSLSLAQNVFNVSFRDEVSFNTLISGYSQTSECLQSLYLFSEMSLMNMQYDTVSFVGVLSACANIAAFKQGKEIHGFLIRNSFNSHLFVANSLLDLYTKCGRIDLAKTIFDGILYKDSASWNTMVLGYAMLGEPDTALNLFEAMKEDHVEPDSVSYIAVLSACSHGGFVEKGKKYFDEMANSRIKPTQTHYSCMVDIFARAGLMKEAIDIIKNLPFDADANIWGALLGACRMHGNIELGCWAAEHLFKLKPDHSGYYVLLSNMFAEAGKWSEADKVRVLMKSRGVKKNPGFSWVQNHNSIDDRFVVGT